MKSRLPLICLALLILYAFGVQVLPLAESVRQAAGSLGLLAGGLLLVGVSAWGLRRLQAQPGTAPRMRLAWQGLLLVSLAWLVGDILRAAQTLLGDNPGLQSLYAVTFVLGMAGLCAVALLIPRPWRMSNRAGGGVSFPLLLDVVLTTLGLGALYWLVLLAPFLDTLAANPNATILPALFPLVDAFALLLMIDLFLLTEQDGGTRGAAEAPAPNLPGPASEERPGVRLPSGAPPALGWITFAVLVYAFADLGYAYMITSSSYQPGGVLDGVWLLGDLFMGLATYHQVAALRSAGAPQPDEARRKARFSLAFLPARFQPFLPLVVTLALGWYTVLDFQYSNQAGLSVFRSPVAALWLTLLLGLGVIARQGMQLGELEFSRYARLVNSIAEPAFVCDRRGGLQLVNPAGLAIAGYERARELLQRPLESLLSAEIPVRAMIEAGMRGGWSGEVLLRRRDGQGVPVMLALRPLGARALAGTAHDLSEQKRQQAALQAAYEQIAEDRAQLELLNTELEQRVEEKTASLSEAYQQMEEQNRTLQQLDQLKSDFVSLVSHELRAPLTNIRGGIELLAGQRGLKSGPTRQTLDLVQAEITRLSRFVETILDLSALEAGRMPLYPAPMALQGVIENLKAQTRHLPGAKRIQWLIPANLPSLMADDQALTSILFHLLDNAIKYAPDGVIEVSAGFSREGGPSSAEGAPSALGQDAPLAPPGRIWINVSDEGPGIPARQLALIFTRFYRANPQDSQEIYGHGLGLYIVKRLLEAMQGEIEVCNRAEGGGACFTVWLGAA